MLRVAQTRQFGPTQARQFGRHRPDTVPTGEISRPFRGGPDAPTKATEMAAPKTTRKALGNSQMSGMSGPK